jgi:hypothetical protein
MIDRFVRPLGFRFRGAFTLPSVFGQNPQRSEHRPHDRRKKGNMRNRLCYCGKTTYLKYKKCCWSADHPAKRVTYNGVSTI